MPMPRVVSIYHGAIVVEFDGLDGDLDSWSGAPLGVELCGETQDTCRYASAAVSGNRLVIASDGKPATRVRYAWADSPVVNVFDARPMPLPGFELEIQP